MFASNIQKSHITNVPIPIYKNLSITNNNNNNNLSPTNYSLKQTFFDPSKSSPPNDFMKKLHMRMNIYSNKD